MYGGRYGSRWRPHSRGKAAWPALHTYFSMDKACQLAQDRDT